MNLTGTLLTVLCSLDGLACTRLNSLCRLACSKLCRIYKALLRDNYNAGNEESHEYKIRACIANRTLKEIRYGAAYDTAP